jgi:hypothetical protein
MGHKETVGIYTHFIDLFIYLFISLIVMMVSHMYAYVQTSQIVSLKYVQLDLNKAVKNKMVFSMY